MSIGDGFYFPYDDIAHWAIETGQGYYSKDPFSRVLTIDNFNETGRSIRIGNILNILSMPGNAYETQLHYAAAYFAAIRAMIDFDQRSSPYSDYFQTNEMIQNCNFYLTMTNNPTTDISPLSTVRAWQEGILISPLNRSNYQEPFSVIGATDSFSSEVIATLGGVITFTDQNEVNSSSMENSSQVEAGNSQGIPNISPSATSMNLNDRSQYPFFARTIPSSEGFVEALCVYLQSVNVQYLAVLYPTNSDGIGYQQSIAELCPLYGVRSYDYPYQSEIPGSLKLTLGRLKMSPFRYCFGILSPTTWQNDIVEIYNASMLGSTDPGDDYAWFFAQDLAALFDPNVFSDYGFSFASPLVSKALNGISVLALATPATSDETFKQSLDELKANIDFWTFFWSTFANEPVNVTAALANVSSSYLFGTSAYSLMTYDAVMALGTAACHTNNAQFSAPELMKSLSSINFTGASGFVSFDQATGSRKKEEVVFQISNIFTSTPSNVTGVFVKPSPIVDIQLGQSLGQVTKTYQPMRFPSGSITPPAQLAPSPLDMTLTPLSLQSICWALAGLAAVMSIVFAALVIRNRASPKIRASQPIFLVLLCVGTLFVSFSTFMVTAQEPWPSRFLDVSCMLDPWLLSIGVTTAFSALFTKTWRINQVYSSAQKCRRVTIRPRDVIWPLMLLLVVNVAILSAWTAYNPLTWKRLVLHSDIYQRPTVTEGSCNWRYPSKRRGGMTMASILVGINVLALLLTNYQCYRARCLPTEYNETFYIWIANVVIFEAIVLGIPVIFIVQSNPASHMIVRSLVDTVFCLGILIPIFLPKLRKEVSSEVRSLQTKK